MIRSNSLIESIAYLLKCDKLSQILGLLGIIYFGFMVGHFIFIISGLIFSIITRNINNMILSRDVLLLCVFCGIFNMFRLSVLSILDKR